MGIIIGWFTHLSYFVKNIFTEFFSGASSCRERKLSLHGKQSCPDEIYEWMDNIKRDLSTVLSMQEKMHVQLETLSSQNDRMQEELNVVTEKIDNIQYGIESVNALLDELDDEFEDLSRLIQDDYAFFNESMDEFRKISVQSGELYEDYSILAFEFGKSLTHLEALESMLEPLLPQSKQSESYNCQNEMKDDYDFPF